MKKNNLNSQNIVIPFFTLFLFLWPIFVLGQTLVHSHNDYKQRYPFYIAYAHKVYSIEADIYAVGDSLLVAHDKEELPTAPTLEKLYLEPVRSLYFLNEGWACEKSDRTFQLMIDLKTEPYKTLDMLVDRLKNYPEVFDFTFNPHAVRIVITSGKLPNTEDFVKYPQYITFDCPLGETYTEAQLERISLFSMPFYQFSKWNGEGVFSEEEQRVIKDLVSQAHAMGKPIRFWGAPDTSEAWEIFSRMNIDIINTDRIESCTEYFHQKVKTALEQNK